MPTVHNGGRFLWGSAWRLEPSRGNSSRDSGSHYFLEFSVSDQNG
jgi:hypothetical protein